MGPGIRVAAWGLAMVVGLHTSNKKKKKGKKILKKRDRKRLTFDDEEKQANWEARSTCSTAS